MSHCFPCPTTLFDEKKSAMEKLTLSSLRRPPQSISSEQAVLGGLLVDNNAYEQIADVLNSDDFYRKDHQLIYAQIEALCLAGQPADVVTVYCALENVGTADTAGGLPYLNELACSTPSSANIRRYAEIVRDRSLFRQLVTVGNTIAASALNSDSDDPIQVIDRAQSLLSELYEKSSKNCQCFCTLEHLTSDLTQTLQNRHTTNITKPVTGLPTGFQQLDRMTSGLQPGNLIVIAGQPSMGKTALAMNIAEHTALALKLPVAVFSLEISAESLTERLISAAGRISTLTLCSAPLSENDRLRYDDAVAKIKGAPFYVDDTQGLTVNDIRTRAKRLAKSAGGLSLIVVDYLQLMLGAVPLLKSSSRTTEITEIFRGLKRLAKELNLPVIALSLLNPVTDARPDKRPTINDLRNSGLFEQDADLILFLYRDEFYHKETHNRNITEIIIAKQRNGPIGNVRLRFDSEFSRFDNLTEASELSATT